MAARSLALRDRGLDASSSSDGVSAPLVTTRATALWLHAHIGARGGQTQSVANSLKAFFTILSSSEWKDMTTMRPPLTRAAMPAASPALRLPLLAVLAKEAHHLFEGESVNEVAGGISARPVHPHVQRGVARKTET